MENAAAYVVPLRIGGGTGRGGGKMGAALGAGDVHVCVPHERTMRIQEVHLLALHCLCDGIDSLLFGAQKT
jgi:D-sedoheptulose 7-phosphate isomerase